MRRNFSSDREDVSISRVLDENISSFVSDGPTKEDRRSWRCSAEKSCEDKPLIESTVREKLILLPGGIAHGAGDPGRVDTGVLCFDACRTLEILMSTRQEPIASAVYRQNIGTTDVEDSRRDRGARDRRALPMNEKCGGGDS